MNIRMLVRTLFVISVISIGLALNASTAAAKKPMGTALLLPIVPSADIDVTETEKIDKIFSARMKKFLEFKISTFEDYKAANGKVKARKLLRCGEQLDCIDKHLRRSPYDIVIVGLATPSGSKAIKVEFKVYNLLEGKVKREKTLKASRKNFSDKKHARKWTVALLVPPKPLLAEEEEAPVKEEVVEEEKPVAAAPVRSRSRHKSNLASKKEVMNGTKQAYMKFVFGDIKAAVAQMKTVTQNRCACDADGTAIGVKAMLEAFNVAYDKVEASMKKKDSKTVIVTIEEMKTMESELTKEGEKLGVKKKSKFSAEMNQLFAEGYAIQAKGQIRDEDYLGARESYMRALEYNPNNETAKAEIAKMPSYARKLFMQGKYMMDFEPEEAKKKLKQVLDLVDEKDDLHQETLELLEEIE